MVARLPETLRQGVTCGKGLIGGDGFPEFPSDPLWCGFGNGGKRKYYLNVNMPKEFDSIKSTAWCRC